MKRRTKITPKLIANLKVLGTVEMADKYGVTEKTVLNWRIKFGIPNIKRNALDYALMDSLIKAHKTTREIMAEMGCSKGPVNDRKRKMGLGRKDKRIVSKPLPSRKYDPKEPPLINPAVRPGLLIKTKLRRLSPAHRAAFIGGVAYQQTMEQA